MLYMKAGYRFNKPRIQMFTEWSTLFVFRAKIEATRSSDKQLTYHINTKDNPGYLDFILECLCSIGSSVCVWVNTPRYRHEEQTKRKHEVRRHQVLRYFLFRQ